MVLSSLVPTAAIATFALAATSALAAAPLPATTTLPIVFTRAVNANHAHTGDAVTARTSQIIRLPNGQVLPEGSLVTGHVVSGTPFTFDKTHYAIQRQSQLAIHFDTVSNRGDQIPLNVYVRALANPIDAWAATEAKSTDLDPDGTTTQIGGDLVTPSQSEVLSPNEDIVGYNQKGGVFAHLIASGACDASTTEQSMSIFSASACGLYGYPNTTILQNGRENGTLLLGSNRHAPGIDKHSAALLEVVGN